MTSRRSCGATPEPLARSGECYEIDRGRGERSGQDLGEVELHFGGLDLRAESRGGERSSETSQLSTVASAVAGPTQGEAEQVQTEARKRVLDRQRRERLTEERRRSSANNDQHHSDPCYTRILRGDAGETQGLPSESHSSLPETPRIPCVTQNSHQTWMISAQSEQGREGRWELLLEDYARWAIRENSKWLTERADRRGLDEKAPGWAGPTWRFAALMRGHSQLAGMDALSARNAVEALLAILHPDCPNPWVSAFGDTDTTGNILDPYDDFLTSWEKVEHPLFEADFERALRLAKTYPLASTRYREPRHAKYLHLVSVCFWLARLRAPEPFFMSVRTAADLLQQSHVGGSRSLLWAKREGLISCVREETRSEVWCFKFHETLVQIRPSEVQRERRTATSADPVGA